MSKSEVKWASLHIHKHHNQNLQTIPVQAILVITLIFYNKANITNQMIILHTSQENDFPYVKY